MCIPTTLWASGGLQGGANTLPLSIYFPRASDPARLEVSRVYISFSKPYNTPSESLHKCGAVDADSCSMMWLLRYVPSILWGTIRELPDCNLLMCFVFQRCSSSPCRPSPGIIPTNKINTLVDTAPITFIQNKHLCLFRLAVDQSIHRRIDLHSSL